MLNILTGKWNRNQKNLQNTSCLSDKDPAPYRLSESELKNTCCPHCHKQGTLVYSKSYFRYFFSSAKDIEEDVRISIAVYYCPVCQTYHSLFPEDVCPFSHFSYSLIRRIISYFNSHGRLLAHTARKFSISVKTLRHLIAIWNQNIDLFNRLFVESVSFNMTANDLGFFCDFMDARFCAARSRLSLLQSQKGERGGFMPEGYWPVASRILAFLNNPPNKKAPGHTGWTGLLSE